MQSGGCIMILTLLTKQELLLKNKRTFNYNAMIAEKERSVVYYQDAIFTHDEWIQQAIEALSFDPIPVNSVFQKEKGK
jgi:hypothetical protein